MKKSLHHSTASATVMVAPVFGVLPGPLPVTAAGEPQECLLDVESSSVRGVYLVLHAVGRRAKP